MSFAEINGLLEALTVFTLAILVGIAVISKVPATLHTPLMSGANSIHGIVLAGRMHSTRGKPAVAQLTAMMLERGTTTQNKRAIAARLDGVGAQIHVTSDMYGATIQASSLSRDADLLLTILADELKNPAFADPFDYDASVLLVQERHGRMGPSADVSLRNHEPRGESTLFVDHTLM